MADDYPIPPDLSGGKKTAFVVEGRRKIHTVWEDLGGIEMAEEYDLSNDELLIRKFKKPTPIGGEGVWVYEIGEPPINPRGDKEIMESVNAPQFYRCDKPEQFLFKVRNISYPLKTYSVVVEKQELILRTSNKKYYKRFRITDMDRMRLPLEQNALTLSHDGNTLYIRYKKPTIIVEKERKAKEERMKLKEQRPPKDGDVDCNPQ
ncbi:MAG: putative Protein DPCD [Streblomastix strix]|uniref:Protein DPCD n=1 Tax=Streblomastix strix TaxID=222440 RepID=A0A5J4X5W8_9EUKA|nr:MAG: putative Protein DPCD [Streblomastix strix]